MGWKAGVLALALLVAGCNQDQQTHSGVVQEQSAPGGMAERGVTSADDEIAVASSAQPAIDAPAPPQPAPIPPDAQPSQPANPDGPVPVMYLAYAYQRGLRLPGDHLIAVMDAHIQACQQAGPRFCQLISSNRSGDPKTSLSGSVDLRAEPRWLRQFMDRLDQQARTAGGKIVSQSTTTEDLTRSIVDTEAQLRAQRTLRDRLQQILATRPGRLSDLLDAERELARVQGEIDSIQSNLAVMRTRVSMSELTLSYESEAAPLRSDLFEPLTEALANFASFVVQGFAAIITVIAVALPWALLASLGLWLTRKQRARRRGLFWRHRTEPPAPTNV